MTDAERIEALEKEVAELNQKIGIKRYINFWLPVSEHIEEKLFEAFKTKQMNSRVAQCKSSISCLVGKAFCKDNVQALTSKEVEEATPFIDSILNFLIETRNKYEYNDALRGYERRIEDE